MHVLEGELEFGGGLFIQNFDSNFWYFVCDRIVIMVKSGLALGANKGHVVQTIEKVQQPRTMKGVRFYTIYTIFT